MVFPNLGCFAKQGAYRIFTIIIPVFLRKDPRKRYEH